MKYAATRQPVALASDTKAKPVKNANDFVRHGAKDNANEKMNTDRATINATASSVGPNINPI